MNFYTTESAPVDATQAVTQTTDIEQHAYWQRLEDADESAAIDDMVRKTATWREVADKYERESRWLRRIDDLACAAGITIVLLSPVWVGPVAKLLRDAGWL